MIRSKGLLPLLLVVATITLSVACNGSTHRSRVTATREIATRTALPQPARGGGGIPFSSPSELAHYFNVSVFAPVGVPLHGGVTAETDATGHLTNYGIGLFNGFGALYVDGPAPASAADYRTAADADPQRTTISRSIVMVQGRDAVLYRESYGLPSNIRYRLLWAQDGRLLQMYAPEKVGLNAVLAAANATEMLSPSQIDSANIIVDTRPNPAGGPQMSTPAEAARLLGVPVFAPPAYVRVLVWPDQVTGKPARWTVDVDDTVSIEEWDAALPSDAQLRQNGQVSALTHPDVAGGKGTYVDSDGVAHLYFADRGENLSIRDGSGRSTERSLVALAATLQRVDPQPATTATP